MKAMQTLAAGLVDGVHESQQAFRALLDALARPGQTRVIGPALPGVALGGALARLLLCLSDDETPVWWQRPDAGLQQWLRFHTGATLALRPELAAFAVLNGVQPGLALRPELAAFAVLNGAQQGVALADFAAGSAESPEFSCTLLIELPSLSGGPALEWRGPGIQTRRHVALQGLPADFWSQWQVNHAAFPQGVDIIFTCGEQALGLPRTTRVRRLEGI